MFDFSFGEMLVVALVALVVLGPERLPKAARFAGLWVRKARAQWYSMKNELEQELASEELKRSLQDGRQAMQETERQLHDLGRIARKHAGGRKRSQRCAGGRCLAHSPACRHVPACRRQRSRRPSR